MKKVVKKASLALAMSVLTAAANAECSKFECENVRVLALYLHSNGDAMVQLSGSQQNLSCKLASNTYVSLPLATKNFNDLYAHLAAYQIMEQPIKVKLTADSKGCTVESFSKAG